jgi:hypothetical protein
MNRQTRTPSGTAVTSPWERRRRRPAWPTWSGPRGLRESTPIADDASPDAFVFLCKRLTLIQLEKRYFPSSCTSWTSTCARPRHVWPRSQQQQQQPADDCLSSLSFRKPKPGRRVSTRSCCRTRTSRPNLFDRKQPLCSAFLLNQSVLVHWERRSRPPPRPRPRGRAPEVRSRPNRRSI